MKPNIDLHTPAARLALADIEQFTEEALTTPQSVEKAVIPLYHQPDGQRLMQIASGVLVKIKEEYFILSASHVFDAIGNHALLTGDCMGTPIQELVGERFSTPRDAHGTHTADPLDASAYRILSPISETLKACAITPHDFDDPLLPSHGAYLFAGFRIKRSNTSGGAVYSHKEAFVACEVQPDDYAYLHLNQDLHLALWHRRQRLLNNTWQLSPTPRGFSGGAMIRIVNCQTPSGVIRRQVLTGIIIEHRKKDAHIDGVLIGTKIAVHMAAIRRFMPELFQ